VVERTLSTLSPLTGEEGGEGYGGRKGEWNSGSVSDERVYPFLLFTHAPIPVWGVNFKNCVFRDFRLFIEFLEFQKGIACVGQAIKSQLMMGKEGST
jgi:hypothetical protein